MKIEPVKLSPNRVRRNYCGGRLLDQWSGAAQPADGDRPEDWLLSATAAVNPGLPELPGEGISQIPLAGKLIPLPELLQAHPLELLGKAHLDAFGTNPGFLLKLLDSAIRLHLQCHPTREFSRQHLKVNAGKTEGYFILATRPEVQPYIYLGFQRPPSAAEFRRAIVEQDIDFILGCFEKIPIAPGDVFLVPGGVPHAIGEGVLMVEIMEPTDLAVRLEFERGGILLPEAARFMKRDVDFALSMLDFSSCSLAEVRRRFFASPELLQQTSGSTHWSCLDARQTDCFRLEKLEVSGALTIRHRSLRMLVVTGGGGTLSFAGGKLELVSGDRVLIPACIEELTITATPELAAVLALPPLP